MLGKICHNELNTPQISAEPNFSVLISVQGDSPICWSLRNLANASPGHECEPGRGPVLGAERLPVVLVEVAEGDAARRLLLVAEDQVRRQDLLVVLSTARKV